MTISSTNIHSRAEASSLRLWINALWQGGVGKFGSVGFGAFSRAFALGSQFVVLILLGKILPKADFGDFMIVFALTRLLSQGMGTGLATLLVYHLSRDGSRSLECSLHRAVIRLTFLINGPITLGLAFGAPMIAAGFGKASLGPWIMYMAPFTLMSTLLTVSVGIYDARARITRSILLSEFIPNMIRLLALPSLLLIGYRNVAVAAVMVVSVAIPWLVVATRLLMERKAGFAKLTGWDLQYSGKLTLHSFAAMQVQGIDMLVVGWLFPSTVAADYAIASRIAALVPFFQQIIVKTFMARAGQFLHVGDTIRLRREIEVSRAQCVLLVTLTAVAALIGYPLLLLYMKNFAGTLPLLAALVAAPVARSYFPGADALLRIAGHANFSLLIMLISGAFIVAFPFSLDSVFGIYALPLGMFVSAIVLNPIIARFVRRHMDIELSPPYIWVPLAVALAGLTICVASYGRLAIWAGGIAVLAISVAVNRLLRPASQGVTT